MSLYLQLDIGDNEKFVITLKVIITWQIEVMNADFYFILFNNLIVIRIREERFAFSRVLRPLLKILKAILLNTIIYLKSGWVLILPIVL